MILELRCYAWYACTDCRQASNRIGTIAHINCPRLRGPDGTRDPLLNDEFLVTANIMSGVVRPEEHRPPLPWKTASVRMFFDDHYRLRVHPA